MVVSGRLTYLLRVKVVLPTERSLQKDVPSLGHEVEWKD